MFDGIIKEYEKSKKTVEKENELLRKEMKTLADPITRKILNGVNSDVQVLHSNQKIIEKETKGLKSEVSLFYKEIQSWLGLYDELNGTLKELGDVVNWASIIERDFKDIVEKMEDIKIKKVEKSTQNSQSQQQQQQQPQQQQQQQQQQPQQQQQQQQQNQVQQQQQQKQQEQINETSQKN